MRAIGGYPPAAIGRARQINGEQMQKSTVRRLDALAGPEEIVVAKYQFGRQQTFGDQALRAIEIGQYCIEQARTLGDTGRQLLPLIGGNHMGQQVQLPWPIGALGIGVDVIGDAVFLDLSGQQRLTLHQLRGCAALQLVEQSTPVRPNGTAVVEQFVIGARRQRVAV
ncbi:hypothetical protein D3C76_1321230 [compost metagenome]